MSIVISYYFNYPKPLGCVCQAKDFNSWIGCSLASYRDNPSDFYCRFLGMEFSLGEHSMETDNNLDFENFKYVVDTRTSTSESYFRSIQMPVMVFLVFALFKKLGITGILTYNSQVLLGRYVQKEQPKLNTQELFDTVSNKFVKFPVHLADLAALMPSMDFLLNWEKDLDQYLQSQRRDIRESDSSEQRTV